MSTRCAIIEKTETGYRGIYCHFDGYLEGVGQCLFDHYDDPTKVSQLIDLGDISSLGEEITCNRTIAYHRDRGEDYNGPKVGKTEREVADKIGHDGYVYVFQDRKWKVNLKY